MSKDKLFVLKPGFRDNDDGPFYCPGCAAVEGVLSYYPQLREELEINYVDFPRPRPTIVELIGEANQGAPVLILAEKPEKGAPGLQEYEGKYFISEPVDIANYLANRFDVARPHP